MALSAFAPQILKPLPCAKRFGLLLSLAALFFLVSGCSGRTQSVSPWEAFDPDSDEAIVLVSLQLDEGAQAVNQQGLIPHRRPTRMMVALYAETETVFELESITLNTPADDPRTLYFRETRQLKIDKPGIYFYGNVLKIRRTLYLDYMLKQKMINEAAYRYPKVFEQLESQNF